MNSNEKGDIAAANPETQRKDIANFRIKQTILDLFSSGKQLTALEINQQSGSNDARKYVSILRRQGEFINDYRLPNRRKVYYLNTNAL